MKKFLFTISILACSAVVFAQHAVSVRKTAQAMLAAQEQKNYQAYVGYFYPSEIKARGGKEKWIQVMKQNDQIAKYLKTKVGKNSLGKVSKIYNAGKELLCLIDWDYPVGKSVSHGHFLAISGDQGKSWKFIMTSAYTPSQVWAMVPKFNEELTWVDYNE